MVKTRIEFYDGVGELLDVRDWHLVPQPGMVVSLIDSAKDKTVTVQIRPPIIVVGDEDGFKYQVQVQVLESDG